MAKYYVGLKEDIQTALDKINENCGFPNASAQTWANVQPTANDGEFYIEAPVSGYGGFSSETMVKGVSLTPVDTVELPKIEDEFGEE